jgi:glutathione S-transferase
MPRAENIAARPKETTMELFLDPIATTSRAVLAFFEMEKTAVQVRRVALMKGEHHLPAFARLNPNRLVPVLVDDDFVLTEASAILRYLARKTGSALYPQQLRPQARVDEAIAWFESNLYRDFGYCFVYPQVLPQHRLASDEANRAMVAAAQDHSRRWLQVLDGHFLGHGKRYLIGDAPTIADLLGMSIVSLGEWVQFDFADYPNLQRWYRAVGELDGWRSANREFESFVSSVREQQRRDAVMSAA